MNKKRLIPLIFLIGSNAAMANAVNEMFEEYKQSGVSTYSEQSGKALWNKEFKNKKTGKPQSCASCHGSNLKQAGKHVRTGKPIEPMAPSVNSTRYTDVKKIKKWFKRNCKWTIGRECSAQEQADILAYLVKQ